jgi:hypothetical protein
MSIRCSIFNAGITTGVNTTIGFRRGDNNDAPAFEGGIGLNLLDGNLTVLAITHIGPELSDPFGTPGTNTVNTAGMFFCNPNSALRYLNDIVTTWKVNDALTLITDLNYIRDDGFKTIGYGVAQYAVWSVFDWLKVVGRAEVWRDNGVSPDNGITHTGFFVGGFPRNFDFINSEWGFVNQSFFETPTTYLGLTAGLNITPPVPEVLL